LIVYFSYRQTIEAYPTGGGSYTVARQNLGVFPGLLAATALMIDYVLVAAVGISTGVGALISAVLSLQPHTLSLCRAILLLFTIVNLRGIRERRQGREKNWHIIINASAKAPSSWASSLIVSRMLGFLICFSLPG
jgi:amino acid transporter